MRREGAGLQTKVQDGGKVRVKVLCSIGVLLLLARLRVLVLEYVHVHNMHTLVRFFESYYSSTLGVGV